MIETEVKPVGQHDAAITTAERFLRALFEDGDRILFRPIETWTEMGRKRSRVDFDSIRHAQLTLNLDVTILQQLRAAEQKRLNLFFGVCPRFGGNQQFDLAWQIRTVRALWADLDHCTVDEALERVQSAGLPEPSIVVNSGNGVHLYWLLQEPYLIDDVSDPPPVEIEWHKTADGRNKPRKYILNDGERTYLDQRHNVPALSARARELQDVLTGIAEAVDGDHTTDVSRLLRLPGSLNRKNQRNGQEPIATELVVCDSSRRYAINEFHSWRSDSPESQRQKQIAVIPLPAVRKPTAARSDKLAMLIAAFSIAGPGSRSEADFAVCCYAIRNGIEKGHVWDDVQHVGKFAERGEAYFATTWNSAEQEVREQRLDELQAGAKSASSRVDNNGTHRDRGLHDIDAGQTKPNEGSDGECPVIEINPAIMEVSVVFQHITDVLLNTKTCYTRTGLTVVIRDDEIHTIMNSAELAGLLSQYCEFYFVGSRESEFRPLPSSYGNTWIHNHDQRACLPVIRLYTRNPVYTEDWRLVTNGYDEASGVYSAAPDIRPCHETPHLDALLKDFCFRTPGDRTNYLSVLLTAILVPRFIGSKPAVLFNGNQPGLGKSVLAQIVSILRDGLMAETATYNPNDEEFEKRLGAIVRRGITTVIIDNAKAKGRKARIDSPCLERSITDPILSFRLLGHSDSIRMENSHIFCITANAPDVSRDLVTRCVVVDLLHEGDPARRRFSIPDPEGYAREHRAELLGELVGMVDRWIKTGQPTADTHSRFNKRGWGNILGGILQACGEPDFLANADEAAEQFDETLRDFHELVVHMVENPRGHWTAADLTKVCTSCELLGPDLGTGSERSRATRFGKLAGRFIHVSFEMPDGVNVEFVRDPTSRATKYHVTIPADVADVAATVRPLMPTIVETQSQ
ncbi:MAG: hypothetical protein RJS97_08745 [Parvibaculaceae bacterium]